MEAEEEPKFKSASYQPHASGAQCWLGQASTPERPCWGEVMWTTESDEGDVIYACEGHTRVWFDTETIEERYTPE